MSSRSNVLIALAAGAALGAIAGILFAPASGKETRAKLMKRGAKLRDELSDLVNKGKEMVSDAKSTAEDAASKVGGTGSRTHTSTGTRSGSTV